MIGKTKKKKGKWYVGYIDEKLVLTLEKMKGKSIDIIWP